jgi:hypothetical protein
MNWFINPFLREQHKQRRGRGRKKMGKCGKWPVKIVADGKGREGGMGFYGRPWAWDGFNGRKEGKGFMGKTSQQPNEQQQPEDITITTEVASFRIFTIIQIEQLLFGILNFCTINLQIIHVS